VLIWNTIPTTNQKAADVEIGQPNMTTGISDDAFSTPTTYTGTPPLLNSGHVHRLDGIDSNATPRIPLFANIRQFPRFALSAARYYIADAQRIAAHLQYEPHQRGGGDIVLGQTDFVTDARRWRRYMDAPSGCLGSGQPEIVRADTYNQRVWFTP